MHAVMAQHRNRMSQIWKTKRAVVVGAGLSGLMAARVLRTAGYEVTIIERDRLPNKGTVRAGAPHVAHTHAILARAYRTLDRLFPTLDGMLEGWGAPSIDWCADALCFTAAGVAPRMTSGLQSRGCTRLLLEQCLRDLLVRDAVDILDGTRVEGLSVRTGDTLSVSAVRVRQENVNAQSACFDLPVEVVVDASGASACSLRWLKNLGCEVPRESTHPLHMKYATCVFRRPIDFSVDWKALCVMNRPRINSCAGAIYPIENNLWSVSLGTYAADYNIPQDPGGFLRFASDLADPQLHDAIAIADPASAVVTGEFRLARLRHFEECRRFPVGLFVMGDSVYSGNPLLSRGISCAAIAASVLEQVLARAQRRSDGARLSRRFQKLQAEALSAAWFLDSLEASNWRSGESRSLSRRIIEGYERRLMKLAARHTPTWLTYNRVHHLVSSPLHLVRPAILWRIMTSG